MFIGQVLEVTDYATGLPLFGGVVVIGGIEHGGGIDGNETMITLRVRDASDGRGWRELPQIPANQIK